MECIQCAPGFYKDNSDTDISKFESCVKCPDGFTTDGEGKTQKSHCSVSKSNGVPYINAEQCN